MPISVGVVMCLSAHAIRRLISAAAAAKKIRLEGKQVMFTCIHEYVLFIRDLLSDLCAHCGYCGR